MENSNGSVSLNGVTPTAASFVDKYSTTPYFKVYDHLLTSDINQSLEQSFSHDEEVILAKLYMTPVFGGAKQMIVFTNKQVRIVGKAPSPFGGLFGMVSKVPVVGWILDIAKELLESAFHWVSKTDLRTAESLFLISDEEILALPEKKPKKIANRTYGYAQAYSELCKHSVGCVLRYRPFSFLLFNFMATTICLLPRESWRQKLVLTLDTCDCLLPDKSMITPIAMFIGDVTTFLSRRGLITSEGEGRVEIRWPEIKSVHPKRWSEIAINIIGGIALFFGIALILNGLEIFGRLNSYEETIALFVGSATTIAGLVALSARRLGIAFMYLFIWIVPIVLVFVE